MSWIESPRWLARFAVLVAGIVFALAFSQGARAGDPACVGDPTCIEVSIVIVGTGQGTVSEFVGGADELHDTALQCSRLTANQTGKCSEVVPPGTHIGLQALPAAGSTFIGWSVLGEEHLHYCGQQVYCIVHTGDQDVTVYAEFDVVPNVFLVVTKLGTAASQGVVTSTPGGISCGPDCTDAFPGGSQVTLIASMPSGVTFGGWGGDCAGFGTNLTCVLTMSQGRSVTATFNAPTFPLTVTIVGQGRVSSTPQPSIACPTVCTGQFVAGSQTLLTAVASAGWRFAGWSGAGCTGTAPCTVTMNQAQAVTATFVKGPVFAYVVRTSFGSTAAGLRVLRIEVAAGEAVTLNLQIRRNGNVLQQRTVSIDPTASQTVKMTLAQSVPKGQAQLRSTFTNGASVESVQVRTIVVPAKKT
jgi:hypothetical protein